MFKFFLVVESDDLQYPGLVSVLQTNFPKHSILLCRTEQGFVEWAEAAKQGKETLLPDAVILGTTLITHHKRQLVVGTEEQLSPYSAGERCRLLVPNLPAVLITLANPDRFTNLVDQNTRVVEILKGKTSAMARITQGLREVMSNP